jgi:hypothetical protein
MYKYEKTKRLVECSMNGCKANITFIRKSTMPANANGEMKVKGRWIFSECSLCTNNCDRMCNWRIFGLENG